jgi:inner membrane protein
MTAPTHAVVALAVGAAILPRRCGKFMLVLGGLCAVLPDLDLFAPVLGGTRAFHRTLTHSIPFASLLGVVAAGASSLYRGRSRDPALIGVWVGVTTLSHALLDMLTTYQTGLALWSPMSAHRYDLAWRPISSVWNEFVWVFLPCLALLLLAVHQRWAVNDVSSSTESPST